MKRLDSLQVPKLPQGWSIWEADGRFIGTFTVPAVKFKVSGESVEDTVAKILERHTEQERRLRNLPADAEAVDNPRLTIRGIPGGTTMIETSKVESLFQAMLDAALMQMVYLKKAADMLVETQGDSEMTERMGDLFEGPLSHGETQELYEETDRRRRIRNALGELNAIIDEWGSMVHPPDYDIYTPWDSLCRDLGVREN